MAWHDSGNKPINSTGFVPIAAGSTTALFAELDSTMLGTKDFATGQERLYQVTWIVGGDTNITWQLENCSSTNVASGVDAIYPKTITGQSAQFVTYHSLSKDYRLRARQFSTGANGAAYISAMPLT